MINITRDIRDACEGCFIEGTLSMPREESGAKIPNSFHLDDYIKLGCKGVVEPDPTRGVPYSEMKANGRMAFIISYINRKRNEAFFKAVPVCSMEQAGHLNFSSNILRNIPIREGLIYQVQVLSYKRESPYAGYPLFRLPGTSGHYGVLCLEQGDEVRVGDVCDAMLDTIEDENYKGVKSKALVCRIVPNLQEGDEIEVCLIQNRKREIVADVPGYDFHVCPLRDDKIRAGERRDVKVYEVAEDANPDLNGLPPEYRLMLAKPKIKAFAIALSESFK